MKKLILSLSILALTLVSCSNEETQLTESNISTNSFNLKSSSGNATLDALYDQMIKSPEYLAQETAMEAFSKKLNFTGVPDDLRSDEKLLIWVENNLSNTGFSSLNDAENELTNLNKLLGESVNANWSFYKELNSQLNPGQLIIRLEQPEPITTLDDCGCKAQLDSDLADASEVYESDMSVAGVDDIYETLSNVIQAKKCYSLSCKTANQNYDNCIKNCNK